MKNLNSIYKTCTVIIAFAILGILLTNSPAITGLQIIEIQRSEFIYQEVNITKDSALDALLDSEQIIKELSAYSTLFLKDTLLEAKRYFIGPKKDILETLISAETDEVKKQYIEGLRDLDTPDFELKPLDYQQTIRLTQLIAFTKDQIYKIEDLIYILENKIKDSKNIDTTEQEKILEQAKISFKEERYSEAEDLIEEADLLLEGALLEHRRITNLTNISKNFFQNNKIPISITLILVIIIFYPAFKYIKKINARKKLLKFKDELTVLNNLIKVAQEDRFIKNKITESTFNIRITKYKERINQIKHTIPIYESLLGMKHKKEPLKKGLLEIKR